MSNNAFNQGWLLFWHSLKMVVNNLGPAALISLPRALLVAGLFAVVALSMFIPGAQFIGAIGVFALMIVTVVIVSIIAIQWHRYILLGELPKGYFTGWRELNYRRYSIQMLKLYFLIIIESAIAHWMALSDISFNLLVLYFMILGCVSAFVFFRLAIGLPAIALGEEYLWGSDEAGNGKKPNLRNSWELSENYKGVFFVVAVLFTLLNAIPELLYLYVPILSSFETVFQIVTLIMYWFPIVVSISLITTLYGYYVQKRAI